MAEAGRKNYRQLVIDFLKNKTNLLVVSILGTMFAVMVFSSLGESPMNDEMAHTFAGYSYVRTLELKYNLEHPLLVKDLSGLSMLIFMHPHFPMGDFNSINGNYWGWQWGLGGIMFYQLNAHPDVLLFFARLPMMFFGLTLSFFVFYYARKYFGDKAGIFALILCAFSPNIIAHSRYVGTDVGITLFFFLSIFTLVQYLENPNRRNLMWFGLSLTGSLLTKYSFVTLAPILAVIYLARPLWEKTKERSGLGGYYWNRGKELVIAAILSVLCVELVYEFQAIRMSRAMVKNVITSYISSNHYNLQSMLLGTANYIKGLPLFITGFAYVLKHSFDGHTAFLLGKLYDKGVWYYFPTVFLYKTQLIFVVLMAVLLISYLFIRKMRFVEFAAWAGVIIYVIFSIKNAMNIGIRHLLPIYPLLFLLVASFFEKLPILFQKIKIKEPVRVAALVLFAAASIYAVETMVSYPYFTQYSNQLIWNKDDSYQYFVDSNLDWGQTLKELGVITKEKGYTNITVDYFANGASVNYYVPSAVVWDGKSRPNTKYFAVSATSYQFYRDKYIFLKGKKPIDEAGYAILIFQN